MGSQSSLPSYVREAHHAGSWYSSSSSDLDAQLSGFLAEAADDTDRQEGTATGRLRAVICPHAGYSYSGPTAAHAYQAVAQELGRSDSPIRTVLVLHPSHHEHLDNQCAVSGATLIKTPLGDLLVDDALRREILAKNKTLFTTMAKRVDEQEHSGELQYPYLAKIFRDAAATKHHSPITVLPVMVGQVSTAQQQVFGQLLTEIISRPTVLTVVSTDFCHWGSRFQFTPTPSSSTTTTSMPIHDFIEQMDRRGMSLIESQQPGAFVDYLRETRNTICGRHAIAVWMQAIVAAAAGENNGRKEKLPLMVRFVKYAQSSAVENVKESSVSYASAVAYSISTTT